MKYNFLSNKAQTHKQYGSKKVSNYQRAQTKDGQETIYASDVIGFASVLEGICMKS